MLLINIDGGRRILVPAQPHCKDAWLGLLHLMPDITLTEFVTVVVSILATIAGSMILGNHALQPQGTTDLYSMKTILLSHNFNMKIDQRFLP